MLVGLSLPYRSGLITYFFDSEFLQFGEKVRCTDATLHPDSSLEPRRTEVSEMRIGDLI